MRTSITTRDVEVHYPAYGGTTFTIPNGTEVVLVPNASGTEGDLWAVRSQKLLVELTGGNTHDPKYRYCWVPTDAVLQPVANVDPGIEKAVR